MNNIVIIGGGASGLMAAISAARSLKKRSKDAEVIILERCERVGRKLLATGNGRCNLTNENMGAEFYHSHHVEYVENIIKHFSMQDTKELFEKFGLLMKTESDGKVYPYSLQASTVLDILRNKAMELGVEERCAFEVSTIIKLRKGFIIKGKNSESVNADCIIMAAGGAASATLGSNGSGHRLLDILGHRISDVFPAITQIRTETEIVKSIQGIKVDGKFTLQIGSKLMHEEYGEILFTEYGISGPIAFKAARQVGEAVRRHGGRAGVADTAAHSNGMGTNSSKGEIYAVIDLIPDMDEQDLIKWLENRKNACENTEGEIDKTGMANAPKNIEQFMLGIINKRVGQVVIKMVGIKLTDDVSSLTLKKIAAIAAGLKRFKLKCIGTQSFQNAQVTAGGAYLDQFNVQTLESLIVPGLYACGEVLDVDGECGGYNLQWAWSSGFIAGKSAAEIFK